ncbi:MAG: WYL domain-containing protein [Acidimicrobiales bacterium]
MTLSRLRCREAFRLPQRGRHGGWQPIGGARTDLTGLTASEVQALFLTVGASAAATPGLKSALRKLVQALPETFRVDAEVATKSVVVDRARWGGRSAVDEPAFLEPLQEAVVRRRQIELGYETPGNAPGLRTVHPLGLVTKAGVWYLVGDTDQGRRVFRVSRMFQVRLLDDRAVWPDDFDLEEAWESIRVAVESKPRQAMAEALAEPWTLRPLRFLFANLITIGETQPDGRIAVTLIGDDTKPIAPKVAGFGAAVEVVSPESMRTELAAIGEASPPPTPGSHPLGRKWALTRWLMANFDSDLTLTISSSLVPSERRGRRQMVQNAAKTSRSSPALSSQ